MEHLPGPYRSLNSDGSLDANFIPTIGANDQIKDIKIQPGGKTIIAGLFTTFEDIANNVARLNGGIPPMITSLPAPPIGEVGVSYGPYTYTASGFPTPEFYVVSGNFPPGLQLNPETGELYGTPTRMGNYIFTLGAYNYQYPKASQLNTITVTGFIYFPVVNR